MHASIVRIINDSSGGSVFVDAVAPLTPAVFAPPAPALATVHLEDTTGPGHATRVLPGDDWVALVVFE